MIELWTEFEGQLKNEGLARNTLPGDLSVQNVRVGGGHIEHVEEDVQMPVGAVVYTHRVLG